MSYDERDMGRGRGSYTGRDGYDDGYDDGRRPYEEGRGRRMSGRGGYEGRSGFGGSYEDRGGLGAGYEGRGRYGSGYEDRGGYQGRSGFAGGGYEDRIDYKGRGGFGGGYEGRGGFGGGYDQDSGFRSGSDDRGYGERPRGAGSRHPMSGTRASRLGGQAVMDDGGYDREYGGRRYGTSSPYGGRPWDGQEFGQSMADSEIDSRRSRRGSTGSWSEEEGQRSSSRRRSHRGRGPKGYTRSDERIHEDVCDMLTQDDVDASDIDVKVSGGEVTLSGSVDDRQTKHRLERMAADCSGVKDVENRLKIFRQDDDDDDSSSARSNGSKVDKTGRSQNSTARASQS